ncbi:MAG: hypothetical protein EOP09_13015, partial [Proteobacteria bacterium]
MSIGIKALVSVVLLLGLTSSVHAQDFELDEWDLGTQISDQEVAEIFQNEQGTLHCERYKKLLSYVDGRSDQELSERIDAEISGYTILLKTSELSFKERRLIQSNLRILRKLLRKRSQGQGLRDLKEKICKT